MKVHKRVTVALVVLCCAIAASRAIAEAQSRIKIATLAPRGSMYHRVLQEVGEAWRLATDGEARMVVYPDGTQGGERDFVRRMRIGQLHGALMSAIGLSELDPGIGALQKMPMVFRSWEEVDHVSLAMRPGIEQRLAQRGYRVLFWTEAGWVRFFTTRPATHPDDFLDRRIFAWEGDQDFVQLMKEMGYHPVALETEAIIPGLQTGLIDTVPVSAIWALVTQIDTRTGYMLDLKWAPIVGAFVVREDAWQALSPDARSAIARASSQAGQTLREYQVRTDREALDVMVARGLTIQELDSTGQAAWQSLSERALPKIRGRLVPAEDFDQAMALLDDYRKQQNVD